MNLKTHNTTEHTTHAVRKLLDQLIGEFPESKKMPSIRLRYLRLNSGVYNLRPNFIMSYMSGDVEGLEDVLFLLSVNTLTWIVAYVREHNEMFWYRQLERLGRNHLVDITVSIAKCLDATLQFSTLYSTKCFFQSPPHRLNLR